MNTQDVQRDPPGDLASWSADLARQMGEAREQARQSGVAKRETLKNIEHRLTERLQALSEELAREQASGSERESNVVRRAASLDEQGAELARLKSELNAREQQWERSHAESRSHHQAVLQELHTEHGELSRSRLEQERETQRLAEYEREIARRESESRQRETTLAKREADLSTQARRQASVGDQRRRLAKELRAQRAELRAEIERHRAIVLQASTSEELDRDRQVLAQTVHEEREAALARRAAVIDERLTELALLKEDLQTRQQQWERAQDQTAGRQQAALEELRVEHEGLARRGREIEAQSQSLSQLKREIERRESEWREREHTLARREQDLAAVSRRQAATKDQRRRLAKELRAQRAEMLAEVQQQRAELLQASTGEGAELHRRLMEQTAECARLRDQVAHREHQHDELASQLREARAESKSELSTAHQSLSQARAEQDELRRQLAKVHDEQKREMSVAHQSLSQARAEQDELRRQLADSGNQNKGELSTAQQSLSQARAEQDELRRQLAEARDELRSVSADRDLLHAQLTIDSALDAEPDPALREELAEMRAERRRLQEQVAELERSLVEASAGSPEDAQQVEDLRRRFEMAVQDLREAKNANVELKREFDAAKRSGGSSGSQGSSASAVGGDWESQKKRLMQQLDDDFDDSLPQAASDKLTVEGAIRITDQMVAEKEREIQELKRLLDDQSSNIGGLAVGATAIAAVLDQDELIREERESLKRVQDEWRDKLRQAEVDISLERAKLARERAELDDKCQRLAASAKQDSASTEGTGDTSKKQRRWLSMLERKQDGK